MMKRYLSSLRKHRTKTQFPDALPDEGIAHSGAAAPFQRRKETTKPTDLQRATGLQRMSDDLHLFLRLHAMGMLHKTEEGYALRTDGSILALPGAHTLYEAYLAIDERWDGDWRCIREKTEAVWAETTVRMALDAALYLPLWQGMRAQIAEEATALLPRYGCAEMPDRRRLKSFTVLGTYICDRIAGTLGERKP